MRTLLALCLLATAASASAADYMTKDGTKLPSFEELAKLNGDATKGQTFFMTFCFMCHQVKGMGIDFGPNLSEVGSRLSKDKIFQSIADPSAVIAPGFETVQLTLEDGSTPTGIVASEDKDSVSMKAIGGVITKYAKADITARAKLPMSQMLPNLTANLSQQDLVDLVAYLASLKKP